VNEFDTMFAAVVARPLDAAPRLIMADWCAEHGNGEFEMALRCGGKCLAIASATCRYKRPEKRRNYFLQLLWENLEKIETFKLLQAEKTVMALTYTDGCLYKGTIVKWGLSESKAKKTPQVFFTVSIKCETDDKGGEFDCPSYERTVWRALTDNTVDYVVEELGKLGFTGSSFAQLDPDHPQAHDFLDQVVTVKCKHETYEGKINEKFEFHLGGTGPKKMESGAAKKLDSLFGGKLKAVSSEVKREKAKPANTAPAEKSRVEREMEEIM
jgi:uncharacterized protein (TIGR02996 family)